MNKILMRLTMMLVMVGFVVPYACAANYDNPMKGVLRGIFGSTITIEVPSLVSKSPTNGDQNGNLTFLINPSTAYVNFNQLTDLQNGDTVSIDYTGDPSKEAKQLVATKITKLQGSGAQAVAGPYNAGNPNQVVTTTVPASSSEDSAGSAQTVTTTTTTKVNSP